MANDVINAVKRLERAGSENSRATKKLHEAVRTVADFICDQVPRGVTLPRGYFTQRVHSNIGGETFLYLGTLYLGTGEDEAVGIDTTGGYLHGDFNCPMPGQTRAGSLQFAKDVAEGLLDEIAVWLEQRASESDSATKTLEAAKS